MWEVRILFVEGVCIKRTSPGQACGLVGLKHDPGTSPDSRSFLLTSERWRRKPPQSMKKTFRQERTESSSCTFPHSAGRWLSMQAQSNTAGSSSPYLCSASFWAGTCTSRLSLVKACPTCCWSSPVEEVQELPRQLLLLLCCFTVRKIFLMSHPNVVLRQLQSSMFCLVPPDRQKKLLAVLPVTFREPAASFSRLYPLLSRATCLTFPRLKFLKPMSWLPFLDSSQPFLHWI